MNANRLFFTTVALFAGVFLARMTASGSALVQSASQDKPTQAFYRLCSDCHDADRIVANRRSRAGWEEVLAKMVDKGAVGSDQDFELVLYYLLSHYGQVNVNRSPAEEIQVVLGLSQKDVDAISAYRKANGDIKDFESLLKVPGIDADKLDKLKDNREAILF
jgi:competence ComEA-like helix-hairpin-helix protein